MGFHGGSDSKEFSCNAEDLGFIPGLGRSPGGGHGNLLQYSHLENPTDRRSLLAWQDPVHGVAKSWTRLSNSHFIYRSERGGATVAPTNG